MPRGTGGEGAACSVSSSVSHHVQLSGLRITPRGGRVWGPGCSPVSCQPDDCGVERGESEPAFSVKGLLCRAFTSAPAGNRMPLTQREGAAVGSPSLSADARAVMSWMQQESSPGPSTSPSRVLLLISEQDATRRDGEASRDPFLWDGVGFGSTRVLPSPPLRSPGLSASRHSLLAEI